MAAPKLTHAAHCLVKYAALVTPSDSSELMALGGMFARAQGVSEGDAFGLLDAVGRVVRARFTCTIDGAEFELLVFDDEHAVLRGPQGETDELYGVKRVDGEDGAPGGVFLERWTTTPAWVTERILDALMDESLRQ